MKYSTDQYSSMVSSRPEFSLNGPEDGYSCDRRNQDGKSNNESLGKVLMLKRKDKLKWDLTDNKYFWP